VLGVAEDADEKTIQSAFCALAQRYHPDVSGSSPLLNSSAREAYETLVDPGRSRRHDRQLRAARVPPIVVDNPNDVFDPARR
jgi:DnaJ-class molecular chaperone